jgi:hypothetical protein
VYSSQAGQQWVALMVDVVMQDNHAAVQHRLRISARQVHNDHA